VANQERCYLLSMRRARGENAQLGCVSEKTERSRGETPAPRAVWLAPRSLKIEMNTVTAVSIVFVSSQLGMALAALLRKPQWPFDGTQACLYIVGYATGGALGLALLSVK
jgi:hypothetical protein